MVRIVPSGAVVQALLIFSGNNFFNDCRGLASSLNEGKDVVDVVGHNVVLIVERKFLLRGISSALIILSNHMCLTSDFWGLFDFDGLGTLMTCVCKDGNRRITPVRIVLGETILNRVAMKTLNHANWRK